jgi:hypothetical protein
MKNVPPSTSDWLDLSQMIVSYVLFLILYEKILELDR